MSLIHYIFRHPTSNLMRMENESPTTIMDPKINKWQFVGRLRCISYKYVYQPKNHDKVYPKNHLQNSIISCYWPQLCFIQNILPHTQLWRVRQERQWTKQHKNWEMMTDYRRHSSRSLGLVIVITRTSFIKLPCLVFVQLFLLWKW